MSIKGFFERINGLSSPWGGISLALVIKEKDVARRVLTFLEGKRVLYIDYDYEVFDYSISSMLEIKKKLTTELENLNKKTLLYYCLHGMREACNEFLTTTQRYPTTHRPGSHHEEVDFVLALGELRGEFGVLISIILSEHKLEVEGDLAKNVPE